MFRPRKLDGREKAETALSPSSAHWCFRCTYSLAFPGFVPKSHCMPAMQIIALPAAGSPTADFLKAYCLDIPLSKAPSDGEGRAFCSSIHHLKGDGDPLSKPRGRRTHLRGEAFWAAKQCFRSGGCHSVRLIDRDATRSQIMQGAKKRVSQLVGVVSLKSAVMIMMACFGCHGQGASKISRGS